MAMVNSSFLVKNKDKSKIIPGKGKQALLPTAAFDRVININLHRRGAKDIVIRSDYELVREPSGRVSVQRCSYKPQIRVQVKAVTSSVGIEVNLYITNFHIYNKEGGNSLLDFTDGRGKNPFTSVDIVFGYAPMFKMPSLEEYYKVGIGNLPPGACGLSVSDIYTISMEKGPPDSVIKIHGYVTNIERGFYADYPKGIVKEADLNKKEAFPLKSKTFQGSFAERLFYYLIQKRFARNYSIWRAVDDTEKLGYLESNKEAVDQEGNPTGFFNKVGAKTFGCKVLVPENSKLNKLDISLYRDENGKTVEGVTEGDKVYLGAANSVYGTLSLINRTFFDNKMRYAPLLDGNWVAWSVDDALDEEGKVIQNKTEALNKALGDLNRLAIKSNNSILETNNEEAVVIPAVYSVSVGPGLCTVECPYFALINPFQKLQFNSRYNLSDEVNYFARSTNNVFTFFALNWALDFSTTGKENVMTIQTIGLNY